MTLQAIICLADGSKRVVVDGVEMASAAADLSEVEWVAVDAAWHSAIPLSPEQIREQAKNTRAAAVASITVDVGGKVFDGDELSQGRMARAIIGLQAAGENSITWTLADNSIVDVTLEELTQALILSGQKQADLWPIQT